MRARTAVLLLLATMLAGCGSSGGGADNDADGLTDGQERAGWTVVVDFIGRRESYDVASDPAKADSDGDGLDDRYEYALGADPTKADTDLDGLSDCQESFHTNLSECQDPAFAGLGDGGYRTKPNNADSDAGGSRYTRDIIPFEDFTGTLPNGRPNFGDGVSDGDEVSGYDVALGGGRTIHVVSNPLRPDTDSDFLEDGAEALMFSSNPLVPDTDGDGCGDGLDVVPSEEERFFPGLLNVTWIEPGASGTTNLRWIVNIADTVLQTGAEHEIPATPIQHGATAAVDESQPAVRPRFCTISPLDPWVRVTVLAERPRDGGVRALDFRTGNPGDSTHVFWSAKTGQFRWDAKQGPDLSGPMTFSGADGSVTFQPELWRQDA